MATYRFLNEDHSLVLRDDHVIAWDAALDAPQTTDEQDVWKTAGSPAPQAFAPMAAPISPGPEVGARSLREALDRAEEHIGGAEAVAADLRKALDQIEAALPRLKASDLAGLRTQLAALTAVVRGLVGKEPKT